MASVYFNSKIEKEPGFSRGKEKITFHGVRLHEADRGGFVTTAFQRGMKFPEELVSFVAEVEDYDNLESGISRESGVYRLTEDAQANVHWVRDQSGPGHAHVRLTGKTLEAVTELHHRIYIGDIRPIETCGPQDGMSRAELETRLSCAREELKTAVKRGDKLYEELATERNAHFHTRRALGEVRKGNAEFSARIIELGVEIARLRNTWWWRVRSWIKRELGDDRIAGIE